VLTPAVIVQQDARNSSSLYYVNIDMSEIPFVMLDYLQKSCSSKTTYTGNTKVDSMRKLFCYLLTALLAAAVHAKSPAPEDAKLYFIDPADGAVVSSPVTVRFGLKNMGVAPAGVEVEGTGHHHLLVNTGVPPLDTPIPADDNHIHFGKGDTETKLELPPGKYTLQLLLGDHLHIPHDPPVMSEKITITVK